MSWITPLPELELLLFGAHVDEPYTVHRCRALSRWHWGNLAPMPAGARLPKLMRAMRPAARSAFVHAMRFLGWPRLAPNAPKQRRRPDGMYRGPTPGASFWWGGPGWSFRWGTQEIFVSDDRVRVLLTVWHQWTIASATAEPFMVQFNLIGRVALPLELPFSRDYSEKLMEATWRGPRAGDLTTFFS